MGKLIIRTVWNISWCLATFKIQWRQYRKAPSKERIHTADVLLSVMVG